MNKINTTKKYIKIMFSVIISFILALTAIIPEYEIQAKEKVKLEKEYFFMYTLNCHLHQMTVTGL